MIRELTIEENYKSVLNHTIELGRTNVFIGENGCGKTNILEAVAMAAAALTGKLSVEELFNRGIRVAKPSITRSSFAGTASKDIVIRCTQGRANRHIDLRIAANSDAPDAAWFLKDQGELADYVALGGAEEATRKISLAMRELVKAPGAVDEQGYMGVRIPVDMLSKPDVGVVNRLIPRVVGRGLLSLVLADFVIYNISVHALRGLTVMSRRSPLGIYGEGLDRAIAALPRAVWRDVLERARCVSWIEDVVVDEKDDLKARGYRLGQSQSSLYFRDRFMRRRNNVFSAENVNEGILHVLFYLALFVGEGTPKVFGIDNVDTALNPQLCRDLMKQLAELAGKHDKQALITTHNPAILDGLNLHDDEQRLFVVYRNDEGHTVTKRIQVKPRPEGQRLKLSELWMRGHLGGIPELLTVRVGLVAEGRGDLAVLVNVLKGKLGLDFEDEFLRPEYSVDETDLYEQREAERGGWVRVKKECVDRAKIAEFLANAIDDEALVVVQIDTAEAHETGFDVLRPDRSDAAYVEELRRRVIERMDGWLDGQHVERTRYAVAIEETDAWVLAIHATKDTTAHRDPKRELDRVLDRKLSEKERKRIFQLKAYKRYEELSRALRKPRELDRCAARNGSLRLFLDSLPAPA